MAARTLGQKVHETCSVAEDATPLSSDAGDRSRTEAFGIGWDFSKRRCATSMKNTCSVQNVHVGATIPEELAGITQST